MKKLTILMAVLLSFSALEARALFGIGKKDKEQEKKSAVTVIPAPEEKEEPKKVEQKEIKIKNEPEKKEVVTKPVIEEKLDPEEQRKNQLTDVFESIEDDDWGDSLKSVKEFQAYIQAEKEKAPANTDLDSYLSLSYVFEKYIEAGALLDGDDEKPPFDLAKNLYVQAQKRNQELEKQSKDEFVLLFVDEMDYLIEDELDYIQEVKESLVEKK